MSPHAPYKSWVVWPKLSEFEWSSFPSGRKKDGDSHAVELQELHEVHLGFTNLMNQVPNYLSTVMD